MRLCGKDRARRAGTVTLRSCSANSRRRRSDPSITGDDVRSRYAQLTEQLTSPSVLLSRLELTSYRPAGAVSPLDMRSVRRWAVPGDDVRLCGETTADAGSADTDRLSVVRQRSDGVEQPLASRTDTYAPNHFVIIHIFVRQNGGNNK